MTSVPEDWIWVLGLIPLLLGVRKNWSSPSVPTTRGPRLSGGGDAGLTGVIGLSIANGGDNIAAYTPVFRL